MLSYYVKKVTKLNIKQERYSHTILRIPSNITKYSSTISTKNCIPFCVRFDCECYVCPYKTKKFLFSYEINTPNWAEPSSEMKRLTNWNYCNSNQAPIILVQHKLNLSWEKIFKMPRIAEIADTWF